MEQDTWRVLRCDSDTVREITDFLKGSGFFHQIWMPNSSWMEWEPFLSSIDESQIQMEMRLTHQTQRFWDDGPHVNGAIRIAHRLRFLAYSSESTFCWYWNIDDGALEFRLYKHNHELLCIHRLIPIR